MYKDDERCYQHRNDGRCELGGVVTGGSNKGQAHASERKQNDGLKLARPPAIDALEKELSRWSYGDAEGMAEAVVALLPTHEQIFDALNGQWFDDDWGSQINLDVTTAGQIASTVIDLIHNGIGAAETCQPDTAIADSGSKEEPQDV